jgi:hypothetical protein
MSETKSPANASPLELLTQWEGPAIHEPGVLFEEAHGKQAGADDVVALAAWIAVTALSGVMGNATHEAIKNKVLGVLSGWHRRFGQVKIEEVKQKVLQRLQQYRKNGKITDEELRNRIDLLFDEIQL